MVFRELGGFGIGAIVIFSAAVFESFVYLISKGALDWGPVKRMQRSDIVSPARTTTTTIRRVGLEGRQPASRGRGGLMTARDAAPGWGDGGRASRA